MRREATSWYARYLMRLYAVSNGYPAFLKEIECWTDAWNMADRLPPKLEAGVRTLLVPKRDPSRPGSRSLMPILDSRTLPILGTVKEPRLAITANEVDFESETDGEALFLILREGRSNVSRMPLDFPFVREALAASTDEPGFTEFSEDTGPRLERFRATRLVPRGTERRKHYVIAHGNEETAFMVEERNR